MSDNLTRTSKFLSLVLRHKPEEIGLTLDENGWVSVEELIARANQSGRKLDRATVEQIVATSDKKRFALSPDGARIRANQGHSIEIDLALEPRQPPEILFHGTAARLLESIREKGLLRGSRQHVHLSLDEATAVKVGQRHGKPVVLKVRSGEMWRAGIKFFCSENGVWLTDHVTSEFLEFP